MALLDATAITKSFAGVQALRGVSFTLRSGEVHALLGENGAGKSTLIKVITGAEKPDSGTLAVDGQLVAHHSPAAARALGIAAVDQQRALFPELTVDRGGLSAARAVPGADGRGEYRPGAGERLAVAAHRLARAAAAGARTPGTRRSGHRAPADGGHAEHAGAATGGDR